MNPGKKLLVFSALLTLSFLTVSCGEARKASKLVEEGNAAVTDAEKLKTDVDPQIAEIVNGLDNFPQNRDQLKPLAQSALDNLDKGIAKLREAVSKYDEGSKTNLDAALKEYLSLKSQEFSKHAEHLEAMKGIPNAVMDTSVGDSDTFRAKIVQINERLEKLEQEWADLAAKANKIQQENKNKFLS